MKILAIESSCDETAASVVENGTYIISSSVASSTAMHEKYGGVVPEIAAREQLRCIVPVLTETLTGIEKGIAADKNLIKKTIEQHIDAVAVTVGPGLIGSLLVGIETAKTIAYLTGKPIIPVNHVLAHMYANFIKSSRSTNHGQQNNNFSMLFDNTAIQFPAISLVVSGGHTELYLMKSVKEITWLGGTLDDAAGEAFDKSARLLGFGTGGGVAIQNAATGFHVLSSKYIIKLPRPMIHEDNLKFSFSGLKTAIIREWQKHKDHPDDLITAFAFEVQEAVTDVLVSKTIKAATKFNAKSVLISGGVSANLRLREKFTAALAKTQTLFHTPPVSLCTDNAVYIASYAYFRGEPADWKNIEARPDMNIEVTQ